MKICDACGKTFKGTGRFCRENSCISSTFGEKTTIVSHIEKQASISKIDACKRIICTKIDKYRDLLIVAYPFIMKEYFDEIKKLTMKSHCGQHVSPRNMAGAVFYIAVNNPSEKSRITFNDIMKVIRGRAQRMREFRKWYYENSNGEIIDAR